MLQCCERFLDEVLQNGSLKGVNRNITFLCGRSAFDRAGRASVSGVARRKAPAPLPGPSEKVLHINERQG